MNKVKFDTDQINIFHFLIDCSDSMEDQTQAMNRGLKMYREKIMEFEKSEPMSIAINITRFNDEYYQGEFKEPSEINTNFYTSGATAMYDAIIKAYRDLDDYTEQVIKINNVKPRTTFLIFTDGQTNNDTIEHARTKAINAIETLNSLGVTTVFVAFGTSIESSVGKELGFQSTIDVDDRSVLESFLGYELSKSTIEQSKSIKALGSDFFSKVAKNGTSDKLSNKAKTVIEDRKWLDDLFL